MSLGVFVSCGFIPELDVIALAPEIERLGFDGMTLPDHLFTTVTADGAYPYTPDGKPPFSLETPWLDALVMVGALGPMTKKLRFVTGVYVTALRHPIITAKAAATAARLCGGRLTLGIGAGWQREEFEALGVDFAKRGAITADAIAAMRALWKPGTVQHSSASFSFGPLMMEPKPPHIPIGLGGDSDAAIRRAAKIADAYILPTQQLADVGKSLERLSAALALEGRDAASIETFVGVVDATADAILAILSPAINNVVVVPWPHPGKVATSLVEKRDCLERCAAEVLAPLREQTRNA